MNSTGSQRGGLPEEASQRRAGPWLAAAPVARGSRTCRARQWHKARPRSTRRGRAPAFAGAARTACALGALRLGRSPGLGLLREPLRGFQLPPRFCLLRALLLIAQVAA